MTLATIERPTMVASSLDPWGSLPAGTSVLAPLSSRARGCDYTGSTLIPGCRTAHFEPETTTTYRSFLLDRFSGLSWWCLFEFEAMESLAETKAVTPDSMTSDVALDRLRAWTGLSVTELADFLGVARRSLYHWSAGTGRPRKDERLLGLASAIKPLGETWKPWQLRQWLTSESQGIRNDIRQGDLAAVVQKVDAAMRAPRRVLQPFRDQATSEVEALDGDALLRQYVAATSPRNQVSRNEAWIPRELVDSAEIDE
jgi:DNA-binding transcriptional regulator YiaG